MTSHRNEPKPASSTASLRRRAPSSTELLDLPDEVLEGIARYIGDSFHTFAHLHSRLREVSRRIGFRIKSRYICTSIQRVVVSDGCIVSSLILTHCHSRSSLIVSCILHCPNLRELSTVNSGLTSRDLLEVINSLPALESLSFSAFEAPAGGISPANHPSIRRIYVESSEDFMPSAIKLVNSCIQLKWLHIVEVGRTRANFWYFLDGPGEEVEFPYQISRERWEKLQTVILVYATEGHREKLFNCVFRNRLFSLDILFEDFSNEVEIVFDHGCFNVGNSRGMIVPDDTSLLEQVYSVDRGAVPTFWHGTPRKLKIGDRYRSEEYSALIRSLASVSTLVELDIAKCHPSESWQGWSALLRSSPGIEYLKVPLCFLAGGSHQEGQQVPFPVVGLLEKLRLRKLCTAPDACPAERASCRMSVLPDLTGLEHLEELTLHEPPMTEDLLKRIANPKLSCLRISTGGHEFLHLPDLGMFFAKCPNLRFLKLDWYELPMDETLFWLRLSQANLKQLCLTSTSCLRLDLGLMQRYLPRICRNLEVLHLHMEVIENTEGFRASIFEKMAKINRFRQHPVSLLMSSELEHRGGRITQNFPGRMLCSELHFRVESVGWDKW